MPPHAAHAPSPFILRHPILTALALSLGTAVALGVARFSYALLLAPMRSDLGWSYLTAGTMWLFHVPRRFHHVHDEPGGLLYGRVLGGGRGLAVLGEEPAGGGNLR